MNAFNQVVIPAAIGLAVVALGLLAPRVASSLRLAGLFPFRPEETAAGSLLFLAVQVGLIYFYGYASVPALVLVMALLAVFALGTNRGYLLASRGGIVCTIFFATYIAYWIVVKYLPSPDIHPLFASILPMNGAGMSTIRLLTIVGISYIGFKLLHFYVDYRSGEIEDVSLFEFLNWLLFFPSIVAGPMQRFQAWRSQRAEFRVTMDDMATGASRILIGLLMKVGLADTIYGLTLPAMSNGDLTYGGFLPIAGSACLYTVYLYLDFAGYSHIAIGTGLFWGIRLPENFNHPFVARNLSEFWNRWHMSLSSIFKEYLFYPLSIALRRSPTFRSRPIANAMIPPLLTFLVVGIWHGAGISFVILGILHGLGLGFLAVIKSIRYQHPIRKWWSSSLVGHVVGSVITFLFVTFTFIFFGLPWSRVEILFGRMF